MRSLLATSIDDKFYHVNIFRYFISIAVAFFNNSSHFRNSSVAPTKSHQSQPQQRNSFPTLFINLYFQPSYSKNAQQLFNSLTVYSPTLVSFTRFFISKRRGAKTAKKHSIFIHLKYFLYLKIETKQMNRYFFQTKILQSKDVTLRYYSDSSITNCPQCFIITFFYSLAQQLW